MQYNIFICKIDTDETLTLTKGHDNKAKGQGQIYNYTKTLFSLQIKNSLLDLDDTYTNDYYR